MHRAIKGGSTGPRNLSRANRRDLVAPQITFPYRYSDRNKLLKRRARPEKQVRGVARVVEKHRYSTDSQTHPATADTALASREEWEAETKIQELPSAAVRRFAKPR
jgi:hypothetical protein